MNNLLKKVAVSVSTVATVASMGLMPMVAKAAAPGEVYKTPDGTVWFITTDMQKRPFTSAGAFLSYGFLSFSQVKNADASVTALPTGSFIAPADGKIFCASETKGSDVKGECSLVTGGMKAAFTSSAVFTGQGFSFSRAINGDSSFLSKTSNIDSSSAGHLPGVLVNNSGTVQMVVSGGLWGIPSMDVFNSWGYSFSDVVPANAADKALSQVGVIPARQAGQLVPTGTTNPNPTGAYTASVSSDSPAASTLVAEQATADLAHFTVMGSGTVTSMKFKRTGVSSDTTLSSVYLFEGSNRLTDAATVSSGYITFSGLNWTVSGSRMVAVKSNILTGTSGQTVGVQLVAVNGTDLAVMPSGATHTIATATLATVAVGAPTNAATSDPGNDIKVWESTFTAGVRDVVMTRMALRQINSIQSADVHNFRLLIDGVQVASQASLDANGYVTFSGFTKTLTSGARNIKVMADVTGGSSRIIQMSLRNVADLDVRDSQYNVNVAATGTFPASGTAMTINSGSMTVVKTSDSPSGNVTNNASDVLLAKYTFTAYGEPIKVESLAVAVDTSGTDTEYTLRNGKVIVNGSQVGSTTGLAAAGAATAAATFTTNFIVNPGTPATVEIRADIYDEEAAGAEFVATDTIQVTLLGDTDNATRQVSLGLTGVPTSDTAANQVIVQSGSMTLAAQTTYPAQSVVVPKTAYKMGAWTLSNGNTEDVTIHTFSLDIDEVVGATFNESDLTDMYIKYNGATMTTVKSSASAADNDWSVGFTLAKNAVVTIELYANIGSTITATHSVKTDLTVTGTGVSSGASISQADIDGQTITASTGSLTEAIGDATPAAFITEDGKTVTAATFKWTASNEAYSLSELVFDIDGGATTVQNIIVKDGATVIGTKPGGSNDVTFSGINVPIGIGQTKELTVELQLGTVGTGAGTSREDVKVQLESYRKVDSQGVQTQDTDDVTGNSVLVFASVPTVTKGSTSISATNSETEVYRFSVAPTGGSIAVKQFGFKVTITDNVGTNNTLAVGDWRIFRNGTEITSSVRIVDEDGTDVKTGGTAFPEGDTHVYVTFGSDAQGQEAISGTNEYVLYATPSGFTTPADDDSFKVEMLGDSSSSDRYLNDADTTSGEIIATLSTAGVNAGADALPLYLLWSDNSAVPHTSAIADENGDDPASVSSGDWTNGYLVRNLPMSANNFVF